MGFALANVFLIFFLVQEHIGISTVVPSCFPSAVPVLLLAIVRQRVHFGIIVHNPLLAFFLDGCIVMAMLSCPRMRYHALQE